VQTVPTLFVCHGNFEEWDEGDRKGPHLSIHILSRPYNDYNWLSIHFLRVSPLSNETIRA
jgi:hypothetical protein